MDRLFDSQNNNRGGYNVGKLYYYEGSVLSIEWWVSFDRFTDLFFNEIYDDDGEVLAHTNVDHLTPRSD